MDQLNKRIDRAAESILENEALSPELDDAASILQAEATRREALFEQSVQAEKTRDDALARRFEEALKQARNEPIERPVRDFDLD